MPTLLALFVLLIAARAALVLTRNRVALTLELALVDGLRQRAWRALLGADWRMLQGLRRSDQASLLITNLDRVGHGVNQLLLATTSVVTLLALDRRGWHGELGATAGCAPLRNPALKPTFFVCLV